MNGLQYFFKCLKNYANFKGRARRREFWYFLLFDFIFSIPFSILNAASNTIIWGIIFSLVMLIPGFAVGVRRMHDVGKSGWYYLIPLYNLILTCTDGDKGYNGYGEDPKAIANEEFDFEQNKFS